MLVLTRKVREQIVIGGAVVITINEIRGNRVILGINAPRDMTVLRGELVEDRPQIVSARIPAVARNDMIRDDVENRAA